MRSILEKFGVKAIWHFTDKSNLALIEKEGILSLGELDRRKIEIPSPGGNEWSHDADRIKGVHEYVHLAFVDDHPMLFVASKKEGRIKDPIWLKIHPDVVGIEGVQYCSGVSNKSDVQILDAEEAKAEIDFEVLFTRMDWRQPEIKSRRIVAVKSEILVPKMIPASMIIGRKNG